MKAIDLFKQDVALTFVSFDKKTDQRKYDTHKGSCCGGLFSILYVAGLVFLATTEYVS